MKEHMEYTTAEDVDGLIAEIDDLNKRIYRLSDEIVDSDDDSLKAAQKRSYRRLNDKRHNLLLALKQALKHFE